MEPNPLLLPRHVHLRRELAKRYRDCFGDGYYIYDIFYGTFFLAIALILNQKAIDFATEHASNSVTDLILSNIPIFDVDILFVYGTVVIVVYSVLLFLSNPKQIPFALKTVALFFIIRAGFVSLTHLAPFITHVNTDFGVAINRAFFGDDTFFSGHTGLPFLGVLAFWHWPFQRYFYLVISLFFASVVLLGHYHYSIDVASAFFITYGIYDISKWLFNRNYTVFKS